MLRSAQMIADGLRVHKHEWSNLSRGSWILSQGEPRRRLSATFNLRRVITIQRVFRRGPGMTEMNAYAIRRNVEGEQLVEGLERTPRPSPDDQVGQRLRITPGWRENGINSLDHHEAG